MVYLDGMLGLATAMALVALRKPPGANQTPAPRKQSAPPLTSKGTVFNPEDAFMEIEEEESFQAPAVPQPPQAFTQSPDSVARIRTAGFEVEGQHTPEPVWNVRDTNEQIPVPAEPSEQPLEEEDPFLTYRAPARARTAVVRQPVGTGADPLPPEDIHVMSSYTEPSLQNDAEALFSNAAASSIEDAIKRYTFDLYDIGAEEFSEALRSIDPDDSSLGAVLGKGAPLNPSQSIQSRDNDDVKARLEQLRHKLGGAAPEPVLLVAPANTAPDLAVALTGLSAKELPDLFTASNFDTPKPWEVSSLEPFKSGLGSMSRDEVNRLWQDYVALSRRCHRDMEKLSPESFKAQLVHNHKAICRMFQCSAVSFHVKLKNGKPSLSARPA